MQVKTSAFIVMALAAATAVAVEWPAALSRPLPEEPVDSSAAEVMMDQQGRLEKAWSTGRTRVRTLTSSNSAVLRHNDSLGFVSQSMKYDVSVNNDLELQNHYLDLSGHVTQDRYPFEFSSLGVEWMPFMNLNRGQRKSTTQNTLHLGPTLGLSVKGIPFRLRGGGAVDVWHDELPDHVSDYDLRDVRDMEEDIGVYGGISAGNGTEEILPGIPVYTEGSAYIREQDSANVATTRAQVLFLKELNLGDSLCLYVADSLLMGKSAHMSDRPGGETQFSTTPHRVWHAVRATGGFRARPRLHFRPSVGYTFSLSTLAYPSFLGDVQRTDHTIVAMLESAETFFLDYAGGIQFDFVEEDWMYRFSVPLEARRWASPDGDTVDNLDTLDKNLLDNDELVTAMSHRVGKYLDNGLGLTYTFEIRRNQISYPNFYYQDTDTAQDTVRSVEDADRIRHRHRLELTLLSRERVRVTLQGEYLKNVTSYVRAEKSDRNKTARLYRIEAGLAFSPLPMLSFEEAGGAKVNIETFHFPQARPGEFPPYSREFYSNLSGTWHIRRWCALEGLWDAIYRDNGYWDAKEYRDMPSDDVPDAFYAIQTKSLETRLELATSLSFRQWLLTRIGAQLHDVYERSFREGVYQTADLGIGYEMSPFAEIRVQAADRLLLDARVKRYIDTVADDYWDLSLALQAAF
ncbi:MAG: hypothetical protein GF418_04395 [Chitinivibrionales bacterium]|nr:hypothetical protein [Chitinivibrionales bacterium]MBD3394847.1 hypothetical protein [Chitinivibrionales bacterium]